MARLKVFVTSCETGEGAWRGHEEQLKRLYEMSDKRYDLTDDPESADIILIGNVRAENWGIRTLRNPLINRYPGKCFSLTDQDVHLVLNHGIYAAGSRSIVGWRRVRTGSYLLSPYKNAYIEAHVFSEQDYEDKPYLLTFVGRRHAHEVREAIFNLHFERNDILIEDSSSVFDLWAPAGTGRLIDRQEYYYRTLLRSKFSLCPRGGAPGSFRLFESMQLGVSPVIISDAWIPPEGPRWQEFSIIIKERHIPDLEKIVASYESSYRQMGSSARRAWLAYFCEETYFNFVVNNCISIRESQLIPEALYWRLNPLIIQAWKIKDRVRLRSRIKRALRRGVGLR